MLWAAPALAQPQSPAQPQPRPTPSAPSDEEARAHYETASRYYAVGRFDEATREFQDAYARTGRAELLFNVGRALEDGGHPEQALAAYERFEREGAPGIEAPVLAEHLAAVRAQLARRAQAPRVAASATRPPECAAPIAPPRPGPSRALPISLMVGGGVALAGALALGATVLSTDASLSRACPQGSCAAGHDGEVAAARTRAVIADVIGAAGFASIAAGVVAWIVQGPGRPQRTRAVSFGCGPSSCGAVAHVTF